MGIFACPILRSIYTHDTKRKNRCFVRYYSVWICTWISSVYCCVSQRPIERHFLEMERLNGVVTCRRSPGFDYRRVTVMENECRREVCFTLPSDRWTWGLVHTSGCVLCATWVVQELRTSFRSQATKTLGVLIIVLHCFLE